MQMTAATLFPVQMGLIKSRRPVGAALRVWVLLLRRGER